MDTKLCSSVTKTLFGVGVWLMCKQVVVGSFVCAVHLNLCWSNTHLLHGCHYQPSATDHTILPSAHWMLLLLVNCDQDYITMQLLNWTTVRTLYIPWQYPTTHSIQPVQSVFWNTLTINELQSFDSHIQNSDLIASNVKAGTWNGFTGQSLQLQQHSREIRDTDQPWDQPCVVFEIWEHCWQKKGMGLQ